MLNSVIMLPNVIVMTGILDIIVHKCDLNTAELASKLGRPKRVLVVLLLEGENLVSLYCMSMPLKISESPDKINCNFPWDGLGNE